MMEIEPQDHPGRVQTRLAFPADAALLALFNLHFNQVDETSSALEKRLSAVDRVDHPIIAEIAGLPAGFACLRLIPCVFYPEPEAELTELYVAPASRRQGTGRALLAAAERIARAAGARQMVLRVNPNNRTALAFYRSQGYAADDLIMAKGISFQLTE